MTKEGRLARGKANYDRGRFLENSETMAYVCVKDGGTWDDQNHVCETAEQKKAKEAAKAKAAKEAKEEAKNAKPNTR